MLTASGRSPAGDDIRNLAPHDLRRTFGKLEGTGQAPLEQVQLALRHQNIQTTQRYLGSELDLADAACDRLGLRLEATRA